LLPLQENCPRGVKVEVVERVDHVLWDRGRPARLIFVHPSHRSFQNFSEQSKYFHAYLGRVWPQKHHILSKEMKK
jgi:hypothetical protein